MKLCLRVSTGKKAFKLVKFDGKLFVELKNNPENQKANIELIKNLKKLFNCEVKLVSGFKSNEKVVEIVSQDNINLVLSSYQKPNSIISQKKGVEL
jgi:uncharacterized protein (TIGR00251 family)